MRSIAHIVIVRYSFFFNGEYFFFLWSLSFRIECNLLNLRKRAPTKRKTARIRIFASVTVDLLAFTRLTKRISHIFFLYFSCVMLLYCRFSCSNESISLNNLLDFTSEPHSLTIKCA